MEVNRLFNQDFRRVDSDQIGIKGNPMNAGIDHVTTQNERLYL